MASRLESTPLLLICTRRIPDGPASEALTATLAVLARVQELVRIRPAGLTGEHIARLTQSTTGEATDDEIVETIRERTEGNPFFVSELLRLLQSRRQLGHAEDDVVRREIPTGVGDVIRLRLSRLPAPTVSLLGVASVAGRDFELAVVATAAGVSEDEAFDLIESAVLVGVVVEDGHVLGRYRFSHSLVRETLSDDLSLPRRARHHLALGRALQASSP